MSVKQLKITGIRRKTPKPKPFPKKKGWQSGQGETKKSYNRWVPK